MSGSNGSGDDDGQVLDEDLDELITPLDSVSQQSSPEFQAMSPGKGASGLNAAALQQLTTPGNASKVGSVRQPSRVLGSRVHNTKSRTSNAPTQTSKATSRHTQSTRHSRRSKSSRHSRTKSKTQKTASLVSHSIAEEEAGSAAGSSRMMMDERSPTQTQLDKLITPLDSVSQIPPDHPPMSPSEAGSAASRQRSQASRASLKSPPRARALLNSAYSTANVKAWSPQIAAQWATAAIQPRETGKTFGTIIIDSNLHGARLLQLQPVQLTALGFSEDQAATIMMSLETLRGEAGAASPSTVMSSAYAGLADNVATTFTYEGEDVATNQVINHLYNLRKTGIVLDKQLENLESEAQTLAQQYFQSQKKLTDTINALKAKLARRRGNAKVSQRSTRSSANLLSPTLSGKYISPTVASGRLSSSHNPRASSRATKSKHSRAPSQRSSRSKTGKSRATGSYSNFSASRRVPLSTKVTNGTTAETSTSKSKRSSRSKGKSKASRASRASKTKSESKAGRSKSGRRDSRRPPDKSKASRTSGKRSKSTTKSKSSRVSGGHEV